MIQPDDIRRKAENLYAEFVRSWLIDGPFFPRVIPCQRSPDPDSTNAVQLMRTLRDASKEALGYGYTVEWQEVNSRRFGRNSFPARIVIETPDDFLRLTGRGRDFDRLRSAVTAIRARHHVLERWIRSNVAALTELAPSVDGLLEVVDVLLKTPRPACFARELPVSVDTKFVERHQKVLRQWLDQILPPHAIRADEDHFERRYGLRYAEPHLLVRFLDPSIQQLMGFPCDVLSLPLHTLGTWQITEVSVLIVENKVNLLTVPRCRHAIALGGLGNAVPLLRYLPWLETARIVYWGDLDVEGLAILSSLRALYPQVKSMLMDSNAVATWRHLAVRGTNRTIDAPPHLTDEERMAFEGCAEHNLRIEQERIPQSAVISTLTDAPAPSCSY
jgi:hypothetical protein